MGLKILMVSVEVAPFAKVGGLADVASSLPKALRDLGHDVKIAMPGYGMVASQPNVREVVPPFTVQVNPNWSLRTTLKQTEHDGVPVWLINGLGLFEGIMRSEDVYSPTRDAYLFLAKAILAACEKAGWIPDVIHCNDWHTGFIPVALRELGGPKWQHVASVFTIHNLAYQGEFGKDTLDVLGLPDRLFNMHQLETFGGVNFLKAGCVFADQVNTVSPTYAHEIQTEQYGCGQWGLMRDLSELGRLRGILNGIDTDFFNPSTDPQLAAKYSADDPMGKTVCKSAVQKELDLPVSADTPIVAMVTRLSNQKGFEQVFKGAYGFLNFPAQFVVLAVGDPWAASELRALQSEWPDRVRFIERYDADLAQRIYAGSDAFLMPSNFEPCGLGQMIAFRYGSVPVVRKTGGLADTVRDGDNGFVYEEARPRPLFDCLMRALHTYREEPETWKQIMLRGMNGDYGWSTSAVKYVEMYQDAIASRRAGAAVSPALKS